LSDSADNRREVVVMEELIARLNELQERLQSLMERL
jgi:hypothetical protein